MLYLKVDIEGYEYDLLASWAKHDAALPQQISFELYYNTELVSAAYGGTDDDFTTGRSLLWYWRKITLAELALLMMHLSHLGYAIVSREDNIGDTACCEFTLFRVAQVLHQPLSAKHVLCMISISCRANDWA